MYFSEREEGERPRDNNEINEVTWGGVQALICAGVDNGSFGATYPETCPDGSVTVGTDTGALWQAMRAELPDLQESPWRDSVLAVLPTTLAILDMIEFCWHCIGKPIVGEYHSFYKHHHLKFEVGAGRVAFCEAINRIFRRNGIAYELKDDGHIERIGPPVLREELLAARFSTGDSDLNRILESARDKFFDKDEEARRDALEDLWDAWERLKTLGAGPNKKVQVTDLLNATAGSSAPLFRNSLEKEARELTEIGNNLFIRHSEKEQEPIANGKHVDYLFHRLFALIQLIFQTNPAV